MKYLCKFVQSEGTEGSAKRITWPYCSHANANKLDPFSVPNLGDRGTRAGSKTGRFVQFTHCYIHLFKKSRAFLWSASDSLEK
jgi:hypothetical protein